MEIVKLREKDYFAHYYGEHKKLNKPQNKIKIYAEEYYKSLIKNYCPNLKVLDIGCGQGNNALLLAKNHVSSVTAIDISDIVIEQNRNNENLSSCGQIDFVTMDAEKLLFEDSSFDMVCGIAVLHHVNLKKVLSEITRVLKSDGRAVFIEPMGINPVINLYRKLTPGIRTIDEHPLLSKDLRSMEVYFDDIKLKFFCLLSLFVIPFMQLPFGNALLRMCNFLDAVLFKVCPITKRYAWITVISLARPNK